MRPFVLSLSFIVAFIFCAPKEWRRMMPRRRRRKHSQGLSLTLSCRCRLRCRFSNPKTLRYEIVSARSLLARILSRRRCAAVVFVYRCAFLAWWWRREKANADANLAARANHFRSVSLHALDAPHKTRTCALCNIASDANNYLADRLTSNWINSTMSRIGPEFQCGLGAGATPVAILNRLLK